MISRFFIDRPIFATVLSIVITLAGGIALFNLPIAQYPQIAPPTIQVSCNYPGASAQVVAETVAAPIEQQVNGVENMIYMSSASTNDGSYSLDVTFKNGFDLNLAQVLVQNRVNLAVPLLPDVIKQTGVTTKKRSPDILLVVAVNSPILPGESKPRYNQLYLSNYTYMKIRDVIARLPGISDVFMLGQRDYSMRIWVDPDQLASRNMTASDVARAIREQNMPVATGQIGQPPVREGQPMQVTLSTLGRLYTTEQFGEIVVKTGPEGRITRIKDVAKVELGAKNEDISTRVNGKPSISMAIFQLPDANALDCADMVKAKMEELKADFPRGVDYEIRYDTTPFIKESIDEVFKTLREAVILVAVVVLLFLQNWRSSVIPLVAVPVGIIGTFAVMLAMGFSINNLTLFGLVLAIGIVVDDAIVVVESVEHHIEHGMNPREATIKAMDEVSGPIVAIGLVLTAVFVPCAFISGITGQFYRQFALTIATSTVISAINSLTLSPALAAMLLRPRGQVNPRDVLPRLFYLGLGCWFGNAYFHPYIRVVPSLRRVVVPRLESLSAPIHDRISWTAWIATILASGCVFALATGPLNWLLSTFFAVFNQGFKLFTRGYGRLVGLLLRMSLPILVLYGGLIYLTYHRFVETPKGFIPSQDMGYLLVNIQLPDSASAERTNEVMKRLEVIARGSSRRYIGTPWHSQGVPGVRYTQTISGQSFLLSAFGSNFGSMFIILDDFSKRRGPGLYGDDIANKLRAAFANLVPEAAVTVFGPPPVRGVGRAGGFKVMVEDRGDVGLTTLQEQADSVMNKGNELMSQAKPASAKPAWWTNLTAQLGMSGDSEEEQSQPLLIGLFSVFRANVPQLFADVDRKECLAKQVELKDLFDTLQIYLGSLYVNDFNLFGRTWQVIVQADEAHRNKLEDVGRLRVRNEQGQMIPIGALANVREQNGPLVLTRYNMYPAAAINGSAGPGVSSGQSMLYVEKICDENLLKAMSIEWTELSYLEREAGDTAMIIFGFAVIMVFLVLAAQYESWALPLAVILVVPLCLLSGVIGVQIAKMDINIFTQIGFVVLVGLASKNAILIVEFAKAKRRDGLSRRAATLDACTLRLRPIVMTSLAFILGVLPLLLSQGAGAEMRRTLGTTVFSGMLGVTLFGIVLTPVFFFIIDYLSETKFFNAPIVRWIFDLPFFILRFGYHQAFGKSRARRAAEIAASKPESKPDPIDPADPAIPELVEK